MAESRSVQLTGGELARLALDAIQKDRTGTSLREHIGEAQTTFGSTDDFTLFCETLQNALRHDAPRPLARYLHEIASMACAVKSLAGQEVADGGGGEDGAVGVAIEALAQKTGYLADRCIKMVDGGPGCCGDFDAWANLKPKAPEEEEEASA